MPQTKTHKKHRVPIYRRPIVVIIFLLLIALAVFLFIKFSGAFSEPAPDTNNQPTSTPTTEIEPDTYDPDPEEAAPPDKITQFEGSDPNLSHDLTGSLSRRTLDSASQRIIISAVIDQYLTSGNCILRLTDSSGREVYQASTPIEPEAASSICGLFRISYENLPKGTYDIHITLESGSRTGTIEDQINI